jgi:hypothetical protein
MPTEWVCTTTATSTQECQVTATTSLEGLSYTGPNFQEWLFMGMVVLFFLSFMVWPRILRPVKAVLEDIN